jgi:PAS domain S-box-containing protein
MGSLNQTSYNPDRHREAGSAVAEASVTERVQLAVDTEGSESTLNEQLRVQSVLLDETRDAILIRDLEDRVLWWNKGAERMYGWQASEAVGQNVYELLGLRRVMGFQDMGTALAERGEWTGEMHHLTKDRRQIIVESRWKLMPDEAGQARSVLIVNTDITDRKRLESQFLKVQRMDSMGRMAGGVAHDLNNVLSLILVAFHQLQRKGQDAYYQRWMKALRINAEHAGQLITQLLSVAKGGEEERVQIQPRGVILKITEILRTAFPKSVEIKTRIGLKLWPIVSCATYLHQVLMNLCLNARDAMPKGGILTVEAKNVYLKQENLLAPSELNPGNYVLIKVIDTGIGIPPEIIDRVFEPFFTTKQQNGTGLGLTAVLRIVKGHGGFMRVSSDTRTGTQFSVYLPADDSM